MADKYLNYTVLQYFYNRLKTIFADKDDFDTLSDKVDGLKTSDITNDGDGTSPFATESYVDENGGKIDVIKVNGTAQTITNKEVDLTVPTKVSDLTNDSNFQTDSDVTSAIDTALANGTDPYLPQSDIQQLIDDELADITGIDFQVVQTLPTTGVKGVIYLVHKDGTGQDIYDEYIWVEPTGQTPHYEKIGTTDIDLSDYWSKTELVAITTAEIDTIVNA